MKKKNNRASSYSSEFSFNKTSYLGNNFGFCFILNLQQLIVCFKINCLDRQNEMESYRKYSSRHHDSRHHKHHKHRHRHHHYRYNDEEYESHRVHQRHHNRRSSDEDSDYEYNRVPSSRVEKPPSPVHSQPIRRPATPPPLPPPPAVTVVEKPRERNWKLIADPFLSKATTKVYRYDGVVPNDSTYPELIVQDPRTYKSKNRAITLPIILPVPKFKVRISHYTINAHSFTLISYTLYFCICLSELPRYLNVKYKQNVKLNYFMIRTYKGVHYKLK